LPVKIWLFADECYVNAGRAELCLTAVSQHTRWTVRGWESSGWSMWRVDRTPAPLR